MPVCVAVAVVVVLRLSPMDPPKPNPFANIRPTQSPYARQAGSPPGSPGSPRSSLASPGSPGVPVARAQPAQPAPARPWERGQGAGAAGGATSFGAAQPTKPWERGAAQQQRSAVPGSWAAQPGVQPGTSQPGVHRGVSPAQTPVTAMPAQPASPSRMTGANLAADFLSEQPGGKNGASASPGASGLPRTQTQADSLAAAFLAEQEEEEQAASAGVEGPRTPAAATNIMASSPRGRPGMSPAVGDAEDDGVRVGTVSAEDEAEAAAESAASAGTSRVLHSQRCCHLSAVLLTHDDYPRQIRMTSKILVSRQDSARCTWKSSAGSRKRRPPHRSATFSAPSGRSQA